MNSSGGLIRPLICTTGEYRLFVCLFVCFCGAPFRQGGREEMKNILAQGTMTIELETECTAPAMARGCILEHFFPLHDGKLVECG